MNRPPEPVQPPQPILGTGAKSPQGSRALRRQRSAILADEGLLVVALAGVVVALSAALPRMVVADTWLAFVDGRWIADHGLPHTDAMTIWTHGARWIDQQWLAHLALYWTARAGGVKLTLAVAVAFDAAALVIAAVAARRAGASPRSAAVFVLVALIVAPWFLQARTQSFALPIFVAVYALLAANAHRPSRRVLLVLPLLALWANLHGSAALGVALVFVAGLIGVARGTRRELLLVAGAPVCLLFSPYAFDLVGYYHRMLIGSPLPSYVDEWAPTALGVDTAAFFALAFAVVYLLARHGRAVSVFERVALPALIAVGLLAGRNTGWLGLGVAVSGPLLLDREWAPSSLEPRLQRLNGRIALVAVVIAAVTVAARFAQPTSALLDRWPDPGADAVATAAGANGTVMADDLHSDWLLWRHPELVGRVAYDVRFELFRADQLAALRDFRNGIDSGRLAARYRVLTFAGQTDASRSTGGSSVVFHATGFLVVRRNR